MYLSKGANGMDTSTSQTASSFKHDQYHLLLITFYFKLKSLLFVVKSKKVPVANFSEH